MSHSLNNPEPSASQPDPEKDRRQAVGSIALLGGVSREMVLLAAGFCTGLSERPAIDLDERERNILKAAGNALRAAGLKLYAGGDTLCIHFLHAGVSACNAPGVPRDWPDDHKWTVYWDEVNCSDCLKHKPGAKPPNAD